MDTTQQEPEDIDATNKAEEATERLANFDLGTLGIPQGAELTFVDREEITCRVAQLKPPRVEYNGEICPSPPPPRKSLAWLTASAGPSAKAAP